MGAIGGEELARWERAEGGNGGAKGERILVSVRMRPLNEMELAKHDASNWECINASTIIFKNSGPDRSVLPSVYTLDKVFGCDSTTKQVYEEGAKEVALSVVSGINSSVFAYGQTSSGKTYTMSGITEYSITDIYDYIQQHKEREFIWKLSAMEIYNESVRDLLSTDTTPLRLLDDPERGTVVEKLTEETLRDYNHLKELLYVCQAQRQIGETSLNEMSSRSHQILRLTIESSAREFLGKDNSSTLSASVNFVDLAGSERASQAMSAGARLKEGCHINRSLLTLGTVIRKLSKGRTGHIPFRDSKLTRILQPSLGGNARTAIICTMSPAQSHTEQSRNTLLFATCAKEVVTNAQVNVVVSDKALVKHLQRELARLESELKYPRSASSTGYSDALREKDSQIKKMEKEVKELMQQRDLAQSRLGDLLRAVGDDQESRQWDELSQQSASHVLDAYEDVLSVSDTSGIAYQNVDLGLKKSGPSSHWRNESIDGCLQLFDQINEQHTVSSRNSVSSPEIIGLVPYQGPEEIEEIAFEEIEDHCKEVRCIEMDEANSERHEKLNLLLAERESLLPPTLDHDEIGESEPEGDAVSIPVPEYQPQSMRMTEDSVGKLEPYSDEPKVEPYPDEPSLWYSMKDVTSFRTLALSRSKSCNAILLSVPTPSLFEEAEKNDNTPPSSSPKDSHGMAEGLPKTPIALNHDAKVGKLSIELSQTSDQSPSRETLEVPKTYSEADISSMCTSVEELKEMAHIQYQKQLADDQVPITKQENINDRERNTCEDFGKERTVKDAGIDVILNTLESPSRLEFEKQQKEIIELWDACNVSLLHRTYFFLLIKGDPADSIYMEVEQRRLSFLKKTLSQGNLDRTASTNEKRVFTSSSKNLRREREMLCRQMQKRLSIKEREILYTKWGISLESRQRKLQLARCLWTQTEDTEHVRESASLVARLTGLLESGTALKEMFGLSFTPQKTNQRSYSWRPGKSSFK